MRVAIMQPYFFPYLGYFQLLTAVDLFIFLDDVQFPKSSWVPRNRILVNSSPHWLTLPHVRPHGSRELITGSLYLDSSRDIKKIGGTLERDYPMFPSKRKLIINLISAMQGSTVSEGNIQSIIAIGNHLGIRLPPIQRSSAVFPAEIRSKGQAGLIEICEELGATEYVNLPGGRELYSRSDFAKCSIKLGFIEPNMLEYPQRSKTFVPRLSVIDLVLNTDSYEQVLNEQTFSISFALSEPFQDSSN